MTTKHGFAAGGLIGAAVAFMATLVWAGQPETVAVDEPVSPPVDEPAIADTPAQIVVGYLDTASLGGAMRMAGTGVFPLPGAEAFTICAARLDAETPVGVSGGVVTVGPATIREVSITRDIGVDSPQLFRAMLEGTTIGGPGATVTFNLFDADKAYYQVIMVNTRVTRITQTVVPANDGSVRHLETITFFPEQLRLTSKGPAGTTMNYDLVTGRMR